MMQWSKKKIAAISGLAIILVGLTSVLMLRVGKGYELNIPIEMVQKKINAKLPYKKSIALFQILLTDAKVKVSEKNPNKLSVALQVEINVLSKKYQGSMTILSGIKYYQEKAQFYLVDPEIESLSIPKLPGEKLQVLQTGLNQLSKSFFENIPVYTIEPKNAKLFAVKHLFKNLTIHASGILVKFGV